MGKDSYSAITFRIACSVSNWVRSHNESVCRNRHGDPIDPALESHLVDRTSPLRPYDGAFGHCGKDEAADLVLGHPSPSEIVEVTIDDMGPASSPHTPEPSPVDGGSRAVSTATVPTRPRFGCPLDGARRAAGDQLGQVARHGRPVHSPQRLAPRWHADGETALDGGDQ